MAPVSSVHDLSIHLDADLTMQTFVAKTDTRYFAALRLMRNIRQSVSPSVLQSRLFFCVVTDGLQLCHSGWVASSVT